MSAVQESGQLSPERVGEKRELLPTKNGEAISLQQVKQSYYSGPFGEYFHEQVFRYTERYGFSSADALKYLDYDADTIEHQRILSEEYIPLVAEQAILCMSDKDTLLLKFVAAFHDIGESTHKHLTDLGFTVVGDIPSGNKTEEDIENERLIRSYFWSEPPFDNLDETFLKRAEAIIAHRPKEGDGYLHELFEAAHHLQAFDTAMTAHYSVLHFPELREKPETMVSLQRLALNVSEGELAELNKNPHIVRMPAVVEANHLAKLFKHSLGEYITLIEPPTVIPRIGSVSVGQYVRLKT